MKGWLFLVLVLGAAPSFAQARPVFTETQLDNYARAVFTIEQRRDDVLRRAKQLPVWSSVALRSDRQGVNVCDLRPPEPQLQALCTEMFRFAQETIVRYGFDTKEFNQITLSQQSDRELQRRLQERLAGIRASQNRR